MADQTSTSTSLELRRLIQEKEHEVSELDLILADYHAEHARLIRELRRLQAKLRDEEEINPFIQAHSNAGKHSA